MTWIKKNYDRFLLAVFALVLLICAGLLINNARGYNDVFKSLSERGAKKQTTGVSTDEKGISEHGEKLTTPDTWQPRQITVANKQIQLPLFRSLPIIEKDGQAIFLDGTQTVHPPVPNEWLTDHNQDLLNPNVLDLDSDGDGFTTFEEWLWDKDNPDPKKAHTDPNDKNSHPPYWSKLYFKRLVPVPFHLKFAAKNGDTFFINNTDDEDAPTQTAKLGGTVALGKFRFKLLKFEPKFDTSHGFKKDVSELTLVNVDSGQQVVLPKDEDVNSPTTYAVLNYTWNGPGVKPEFAVQKDGEFTLPPENNVKYKVIDLNDTGVKVVKLDENKELQLKTQPPPIPHQ